MEQFIPGIYHDHNVVYSTNTECRTSDNQQQQQQQQQHSTLSGTPILPLRTDYAARMLPFRNRSSGLRSVS